MLVLKLILTPLLMGGVSLAGRKFGPNVSGLLSPLPIFATIVVAFTYRFQGAAAARQVLHGVLVSSFACAVFFFVVAGLLERWGIIATFIGATLAALLTQGCSLYIMRKVEL